MRRLLGAVLLIGGGLAAPRALALDVMSMYRGSCQVDSGVVLRVDARSVTFLDLGGAVRRIPRYEIVGLASYPLPHLSVQTVTIPPEPKATEEGAAVDPVTADLFEFLGYRDGGLVTLAVGWPIEYNAEHVQVLTTTGRDHLIVRDDIWGVRSRAPGRSIAFSKTAAKSQSYRLRHPLAFESCPENVTPGVGEPVPVIPQTTYDNPIAIKRYHDHLRDGYAKIRDYEDRQKFYAVPQVYGNRTRLGTWAIVGSRYANVGSRQTNFLPLVEDEYSEGPFGFQRVVRSGIAPLAWGLHEEPTVQIFYGLKADYVHFEAFFDPTSPLIGAQYNYNKGQLDPVDERIVEKGGLEFGFDFGYVSLFTAFSGGNLGIRAGDHFYDGTLESSRSGLSFQYNLYKAAFYVGRNGQEIEEHLRQNFDVVKVVVSGPLSERWFLKAQAISRQLGDAGDAKTPLRYDAQSNTLAGQLDWDATYRWRVSLLVSIEQREASYEIGTGGEDAGATDSVSAVHPKVASGVSVMF
jgi:hypothetical protein